MTKSVKYLLCAERPPASEEVDLSSYFLYPDLSEINWPCFTKIYNVTTEPVRDQVRSQVLVPIRWRLWGRLARRPANNIRDALRR